MSVNPVIWTILSLVPHLLRCGQLVSAGNGGSSETVNAKVTVIDTVVCIEAENTGAEPLRAGFFSSDYNPFHRSGTADSVSDFSASTLLWGAPAAGVYNVILSLADRSCFLGGVTLVRGVSQTIPCRLAPAHTLAGNVVFSDSSEVTETYLLLIRGSPYYSVTGSFGSFAIPGVPRGNYTVTVRATARRLFAVSSDYRVITDVLGPATRLRIVVP